MQIEHFVIFVGIVIVVFLLWVFFGKVRLDPQVCEVHEVLDDIATTAHRLPPVHLHRLKSRLEDLKREVKEGHINKRESI